MTNPKYTNLLCLTLIGSKSTSKESLYFLNLNKATKDALQILRIPMNYLKIQNP